MDAAENAIALATLNDISIKDSTYKIMEDGNICIGSLKEGVCTGDILKIDISGEFPTEGSISISSGKIKEVLLIYSDKKIEVNDEGEIIQRSYNMGDIITYDPGDGINTKWYVIDESNDTLTLLLDSSIGKSYWQTGADYRLVTGTTGTGQADTNEGPISLLKTLNTLTSNWHIDKIENYSYINNKNGTTKVKGYQKLDIINGVSTIINQAGGSIQIDGDTKARILTIEETLELISSLNPNLSENNLTAYLERNEKQILEFMSNEGLILNNIDEYFSMAGVERNHLYMYMIVPSIVLMGIESDYDISLPQWFTKMSFWTISSEQNNQHVALSKVVDSANFEPMVINDESSQGVSLDIHPVITVKKSSIK